MQTFFTSCIWHPLLFSSESKQLCLNIHNDLLLFYFFISFQNKEKNYKILPPFFLLQKKDETKILIGHIFIFINPLLIHKKANFKTFLNFFFFSIQEYFVHTLNKRFLIYFRPTIFILSRNHVH